VEWLPFTSNFISFLKNFYGKAYSNEDYIVRINTEKKPKKLAPA
jgi:hypothetical protein